MTTNRRITLYHAPHSRSGGVLVLLDELAAEHDLVVLNLKRGEQREPAYLAVNPMGKVPAIVHDGALVTEQGAVYAYLADLHPERGLAPPIGDPLRGPYLRWLFFYGSSFEPAVTDRAMKRDPAPESTSPYGTFDSVIQTLDSQLAKGPWLLGERFSAADVLWGSALRWTTMFGLVPVTPAIGAYIERFAARPAVVRSTERDAALAKAQEG